MSTSQPVRCQKCGKPVSYIRCLLKPTGLPQHKVICMDCYRNK
ncbi:MAG: hypothetical protein ACQCN4_09455 [Candidatus Bathyarchaeia archaeon]